MATKTLGILALALALILPSASLACAFEAWDFAIPGFVFTNGNWTFGEVFVPTQDIAVSFLGYYAPFGHGNFLSDHPVGMFDAAGNLLASTVINNSSMYGDFSRPLINPIPTGNFAFNYISPITLHAGQTYVIEGVSNSDPYAFDDVGFTVYLPITILGNNWIFENGLTFNGTFVINDVSDGYWGPNFGTTPEPGSLILLGSGILGMAGVLRRKLTF
ncbi:MAG TPA: PEP-CTERM sorting domain-containing protein [Terriglobales bacterium]